MNQQSEQTSGATQAEPRAEWIRPEVNTLSAGAAEAADTTGSDGTFTS